MTDTILSILDKWQAVTDAATENAVPAVRKIISPRSIAALKIAVESIGSKKCWCVETEHPKVSCDRCETLKQIEAALCEKP